MFHESSFQSSFCLTNIIIPTLNLSMTFTFNVVNRTILFFLLGAPTSGVKLLPFARKALYRVFCRVTPEHNAAFHLLSNRCFPSLSAFVGSCRLVYQSIQATTKQTRGDDTIRLTSGTLVNIAHYANSPGRTLPSDSVKILDRETSWLERGVKEAVVVDCSGLLSISTIFQLYHDGVWLRQGAQCSLL